MLHVITDSPVQPDFDADDGVPVGEGGFDAGPDLDGVQVVVFAAGSEVGSGTAGAGHPVAGHVQQGQDSGPARLADELAEAGEGHAP